MSFTSIDDGCPCDACKQESERKDKELFVFKARKASSSFFNLPVQERVQTPVLNKALVQFIPDAKPAPKVTTKLNYMYEMRDFHSNPEAVRGEYISGGCYGKVWGHKDVPGLVVKEFDVADGYPVWMAYAALAYRQGMGNSVLPRIYAVSLPDRVHIGMKGHVLMERLDKRVCDVEDDAFPGFVGARNKLEELAQSALSGYAVDPIAAVLHSGYKSADRFYSLSTKHMQRVAATVRAAGIGLNTDMHRGNFMLRKNEVVITDPFTLELQDHDKKDEQNARLHAMLTRMCKEAAAFTPGFYSEYSMRREINIS